MDVVGKSGFIYVLSNESLNNMVKIGRTHRDPEVRTNELSSATGVPTPFKLEYKKNFSDSIRAEKLIHKLLELDGKRVTNRREFFNISVSDAIETIRAIEKEYFELDSNEMPKMTSHVVSRIKKDANGDEIKVKVWAEKTAVQDDVYHLTKTIEYSDNRKETEKYLTNDLDSFFKDPLDTPDELNPTAQLIEDLNWEGENMLSGFNADGIIDINAGTRVLEQAIQLGSAAACYTLGDYYENKYIQDRDDDKSRLLARSYYRQGIKLTGQKSLHCIYKLTTRDIYSDQDEGFDRYIIINNILSYWRMFFERIKEIKLNNIDSFTYSLIVNSINEFFTNYYYVYNIEKDNRLKEPYQKAIKEGLEIIQYNYFDLIKKICDSNYIAMHGEKKQKKQIQFLEYVFNIDSYEKEFENFFEGNSMKVASLEKGNYMITGKMQGELNANDLVSISVWPNQPRYFTIRSIDNDSKKNQDVLYVEGIYPNFYLLKSDIERAKKNRSIEYPISISRSQSIENNRKSVEEVLEYLLNEHFSTDSEVQRKEKKDVEEKITNTSFNHTDSENHKKNYGLSKEEKKQGQGLLDKVKKWFNKN